MKSRRYRGDDGVLKDAEATTENWIDEINLSEIDLQIPKEYTRLLTDMKKQEKNVVRCMPHTVHTLPKVDTQVSHKSHDYNILTG